MASSEAFCSHFNCLTLVPFLCLIVTSDLPIGAFCAKQQGSKLAFPVLNDFVHDLDIASTTNYANIFSNINVKQSASVKSPVVTFPNLLASSLPSRIESALNEATANKEDNEDTILILGNTNKGSPSSLLAFHDDEVSGDSSLSRRNLIYHSSKLFRPRRTASGKINTFLKSDYDQGTTTLRVASTKPNIVNEPSISSAVKALNEMRESPTYPEQVEAKLLDSFPVAYLMNSQYELDPPFISNSFDFGKGGIDDGRDGNDIVDQKRERLVYRSDKNSKILSATNARDFEISLLLQNSENDETPPLDSSTTVRTPDGTAAMIVEQVPTNALPVEEEPVTNSISVEDNENFDNSTDEQGTIPLRKSCNETSQCFGEHVECRLGICKCQLGYLPRIDNGELCGEASAHHVEVPTTDPTMIGVVVGLALMSVTLCIVLRLFAKARFRENRTIFNTPNPRLMNVSLLKGNKTLLRGNSAGQRSRRGSVASMTSGQGDGHGSPTNPVEGNGSGSSAHPHRIKPSRTLSTDTTNLEGTPTSSRPHPSNRSKFRQDSVASNV